MTRYERIFTGVCVVGTAMFIGYYTGYINGWRAHLHAKATEVVVMRSKFNRDECYLLQIPNDKVTQTPIECPESAANPF